MYCLYRDPDKSTQETNVYLNTGNSNESNIFIKIIRLYNSRKWPSKKWGKQWKIIKKEIQKTDLLELRILALRLNITIDFIINEQEQSGDGFFPIYELTNPILASLDKTMFLIASYYLEVIDDYEKKCQNSNEAIEKGQQLIDHLFDHEAEAIANFDLDYLSHTQRIISSYAAARLSYML